VEPRLLLAKRISLGLRYDVGVFGFGEQRIGESNDRYRIVEPDLSRIRSAALLGYFHFKILSADFNAGIGLQYARTADRSVKTHLKSNDRLVEVNDFEGHNRFGVGVSGGVDLGPLFFSAKFGTYRFGSNNSIVDTYTNLSFGYTIMGERTGWRKTEEARRIPIIFLEFGAQYLLPFSISKNAAALGGYLEPKLAISKNSSVGFRFDFDRGRNKGLDLAFGFRNTSNGEMRELRRLNELSYTQSIMMTYDYYFPTVGGWYFIGAGAGQYRRDEMQDFGNGFFFGTTTNFEPLPEVKNIGGLIRVGMKTSLVRFTLGYNYTGKNVPDYISFQVGFEPSFSKSE